MHTCPFYGFHWPQNSSKLRHTGGNECGLDLDKHGPCRMELDGLAPDYFACPVVQRERHALQAGKHVITFVMPDGKSERLDQWIRAHQK